DLQDAALAIRYSLLSLHLDPVKILPIFLLGADGRELHLAFLRLPLRPAADRRGPGVFGTGVLSRRRGRGERDGQSCKNEGALHELISGTRAGCKKGLISILYMDPA